MEASRKFINFHIYREFCRLFPSVIGHHSNPVEMSPFLMTMRILKQIYSFHKPEVYSTLTALLQDYDPSLGAKHRETTIRYLRLLLVDQPELADYLIYLLPDSKKAESADNSTGQHSSNEKGEEKPTSEGSVEELHGNNYSRHVFVFPSQDSLQDISSSSSIRIPQSVNIAVTSAAPVSTMAPSSVITLGKISIPQLSRKPYTSQIKQLQIQSKKKPLKAVLYNPSVLIKGSVIGESSSVVVPPRTSSVTDAGTYTSTAQDTATTLARHIGLRLATHLSSFQKNDDRAILPNSCRATCTLLKGAPKFQPTPAHHTDVRISGGRLEEKVESMIKKFGKEMPRNLGRPTSVNQQMHTAGAMCNVLQSAAVSAEMKDSTGFHGRPAAQSVAYSLGQPGMMRSIPGQAVNQPMLVLEKPKQSLIAAKSDASGIRIITKYPDTDGNLSHRGLGSLPDSSPLTSLRNLVARVGTAEGGEGKILSPLPSFSSQLETTLKDCSGDNLINYEKLNDDLLCADIGALLDADENATMPVSTDQTSLKMSNCEAVDDKTGIIKENSDVVLNISSETDGRRSPYSDETSHSIFFNDRTSDFHVSDDDQAVSTDGVSGSRCEIKRENSPSSGSINQLQTHPTSTEKQLLDQKPWPRKLKIVPFTDETAHYEGNTYLARLIGTPSPPAFEHGSSFDLFTEERKRKTKIGIKRKRKKQV